LDGEVKDPPPPPPVEVIVENIDGLPDVPLVPSDVAPAPPAPIVIGNFPLHNKKLL
jgi:hypothetical protein